MHSVSHYVARDAFKILAISESKGIDGIDVGNAEGFKRVAAEESLCAYAAVRAVV